MILTVGIRLEKRQQPSFKCDSNPQTSTMTKPPALRPLRSSAEPVFVTEVPMTARAPGTRVSFTRSREERKKLVDVVHNPKLNGRDLCQREIVNAELLNFKFWGTLRESRTEVKNTLPSIKTIEKEKLAIDFARNKRTNPEGVAYKEFYNEFYDNKYGY
ncbi:uncharacterized protein LOC135493961 [Lineus longissimus]|uniref:uncharacterized protein LOC135493961 n=1 Tax=Lineus longissimus TaxID=88925 RepID=UPI002B4EFF2D